MSMSKWLGNSRYYYYSWGGLVTWCYSIYIYMVISLDTELVVGTSLIWPRLDGFILFYYNFFLFLFSFGTFLQFLIIIFVLCVCVCVFVCWRGHIDAYIVDIWSLALSPAKFPSLCL